MRMEGVWSARVVSFDLALPRHFPRLERFVETVKIVFRLLDAQMKFTGRGPYSRKYRRDTPAPDHSHYFRGECYRDYVSHPFSVVKRSRNSFIPKSWRRGKRDSTRHVTQCNVDKTPASTLHPSTQYSAAQSRFPAVNMKPRLTTVDLKYR